MQLSSVLKIWAAQVRAPFLVLPVILVGIGGAVAHHDGAIVWQRLVLCVIGVVLAHVAVNLFNEYSDNRTGIDHHTRRTPFSGGSGNLQAGRTLPRSVLTVAIVALGIAAVIGMYLAAQSGWLVLLFMALGGTTAVFYTTHLAKWGIGELMAGLCLGSLVVAGTYFTQTGAITRELLWLSVPPGILTGLLLFLNEFPDAQADRAGGRRHLVILLGHRGAAVTYCLALALCYGVIVGGVITGWFPIPLLLAALTLPLGVKTSITALRHGEQFEKMVPALGTNVIVVLGTDLLMVMAYLL